uniref:BACK domain-containing protein n=1 Tax=Amblyomma sculptum TaxID=1581419 RepID=A0A1E1XPE9_AMBSC
MFASGMKESSCEEIEMRDIEPDTLQALVDVSEGRAVKVVSDNVDRLLRAGCLFQFEQLQSDCVDHLLGTMCLANAVETWQKGDAFGVRQLCRAALITLLWEFEEFARHASLAGCPRALLESVLSKDTLNVSSEATVVKAAKHWIKVNSASCAVEDVVTVASCVRHGQLDAQDSAQWSSFLESLFSELCADTVERWREPLQRAAAAAPRSAIVRPAVVVSELVSDEVARLAVYCAPGRSDAGFAFHSPLPSAHRPECLLRGFVICSVGKDAYFLCGEYGIRSGNWNRHVLRWCHVLSRWTQVAMLPEPRRHCKATVVGNRIHLCGGFGRYRVRLFSVDIYDPTTGTWERGEELLRDQAIDASAIVNLKNQVCIIPTCPANSHETSHPIYSVSDTVSMSQTVAIPFSSHRTVVVCKGADNWYTFHEPRTFSEYANPKISLRSLLCGCALGDGIGFFVEDLRTGVVYNFDTDEQQRLNIGLCDVSIECCFGMPYFDLDD